METNCNAGKINSIKPFKTIEFHMDNHSSANVCIGSCADTSMEHDVDTCTNEVRGDNLKSSDENNCMVCIDENKQHIKYFDCIKYHNICTKCFNKLVYFRKKNSCPLCNAKMSDICKSPSTLTVIELMALDVKQILQRHIFIHQNYEIDPNYKLITIDNNGQYIKLYSYNGKLADYNGMFLCDNGFLYIYDNNFEKYHIAVQKNKYQFWDISRIYRLDA